MKRNTWKFEYTGRALAEAAAKQRDHRLERLKVWSERKDEIMKTIREKGLTVDEGNAVAMHANYSNTMVAGPTVLVDVQLQRNLQEAHGKVSLHENAARDYDGWVQVMSANPDQVVKLNHDDWLYFFGK